MRGENKHTNKQTKKINKQKNDWTVRWHFTGLKMEFQQMFDSQ